MRGTASLRQNASKHVEPRESTSNVQNLQQNQLICDICRIWLEDLAIQISDRRVTEAGRFG